MPAEPITQRCRATSTAGILAIAGVLGALWSASGYINSFMQAANSIYDVPEGRPFYNKIPNRLGISILAGAVIGGTAQIDATWSRRFCARRERAIHVEHAVPAEPLFPKSEMCGSKRARISWRTGSMPIDRHPLWKPGWIHTESNSSVALR